MKKTPVIIDCDTGIDDAISLTLLLASKSIDIKGITTVAGNINLDLTTYNTLNVLTLMNHEHIPLAKGEAKPLNRVLKDAGEVHGESGLGTYLFKEKSAKRPVEDHAVEFLYDLLLKSDEKITILALAPLTNIAKLFMDHPDCKEKIDKIIFMGGSIFTGNPTPVSTFNILVDPEAAKLVFESGVPFHMCPLDTTKDAYITNDEVELIGEINNQVAQMVYELCKFLSSNEEIPDKRFKGLCMHDLTTAAYLTNPELFTTKLYYGDVETKGDLTTGFTMIDYENILHKSEAEKNITYIDSVNREGVIKVFFEALKSFH